MQPADIRRAIRDTNVDNVAEVEQLCDRVFRGVLLHAAELARVAAGYQHAEDAVLSMKKVEHHTAARQALVAFAEVLTHEAGGPEPEDLDA